MIDPPDDWYKRAPQPPPLASPTYVSGTPLEEGQRFTDAIAGTGLPGQRPYIPLPHPPPIPMPNPPDSLPRTGGPLMPQPGPQLPPRHPGPFDPRDRRPRRDPGLPGLPRNPGPFPPAAQERSSMVSEEEALDMLYQMLQGDNYDE